MHKKYVTYANNYTQRTKGLLMEIPGTLAHEEEGMASDVFGLRVLGVPVFLRGSKIYAEKECISSLGDIYLDNVNHIYFTEKYITIISSDEKTHLISIFKDGSEIFTMASRNFTRKYKDGSVQREISSYVARPALLRTELNSMYIVDFCAPKTAKNYLDAQIWFDSGEPVHENIKVFYGYTNIEANQAFSVNGQEWLCIFKGSNVFLGLKKV